MRFSLVFEVLGFSSVHLFCSQAQKLINLFHILSSQLLVFSSHDKFFCFCFVVLFVWDGCTPGWQRTALPSQYWVFSRLCKMIVLWSHFLDPARCSGYKCCLCNHKNDVCDCRESHHVLGGSVVFIYLFFFKLQLEFLS